MGSEIKFWFLNRSDLFMKNVTNAKNAITKSNIARLLKMPISVTTTSPKNARKDPPIKKMKLATAY
jgi:hypothetical protein